MLGKGESGMSISEFIGFLITVLFLFVLYVKQAWESRKRAQHPELYKSEEEEQEEALKDLLETLHIDKEAYKDILPTPQPQIQRPHIQKQNIPPKPRILSEDTQFHFDVSTEKFKQKTKVESVSVGPKFIEDIKSDSSKPLKGSEINPYLSGDKAMKAYDLNIRFLPSRGKKLVMERVDLRNQIIIKEILGKPKALDFDHGQW